MFSIEVRSPRLIVLILDGCRYFTSDEPLVDGTKVKHGLDFVVQKRKTVPDTVIAHACAPNALASDSGKETTEKHTSGGTLLFVYLNASCWQLMPHLCMLLFLQVCIEDLL